MASTALDLRLTVNGEPRRAAAGATIAEFVASIGLNPGKVAVERNGAVVPRSSLDGVALADGDVLEIVHFVGGGDHVALDDDSWTGRRPNLPLAPDRRHRQVQGLRSECGRCGGLGRRNRHGRRTPLNVSDPSAPS